MTYEDFDKLYLRMVAEEAEVGKTKGIEYTQGDRLDNFKRLAKELGITPKQALLVYLKKHLDSVYSYVKREAAGEEFKLSEPIEGRIMDARVYLALLRGLIEEKNETSR